jgi:hypothetical protein
MKVRAMSDDDIRTIIEDDDDEDQIDAGSESKPKQADILIELAEAATLFHTPAPDNDAFADITIKGHRETHRVRGKGFREWLRYKYFKTTNSGCNADAMQVAIETIAAKAKYEGQEHKVHVRVAEHGGAIYIDIGRRLEGHRGFQVRLDDHRQAAGALCAHDKHKSVAAAAARRLNRAIPPVLQPRQAEDRQRQ